WTIAETRYRNAARGVVTEEMFFQKKTDVSKLEARLKTRGYLDGNNHVTVKFSGKTEEFSSDLGVFRPYAEDISLLMTAAARENESFSLYLGVDTANLMAGLKAEGFIDADERITGKYDGRKSLEENSTVKIYSRVMDQLVFIMDRAKKEKDEFPGPGGLSGIAGLEARFYYSLAGELIQIARDEYNKKELRKLREEQHRIKMKEKMSGKTLLGRIMGAVNLVGLIKTRSRSKKVVELIKKSNTVIIQKIFRAVENRVKGHVLGVFEKDTFFEFMTKSDDEEIDETERRKFYDDTVRKNIKAAMGLALGRTKDGKRYNFLRDFIFLALVIEDNIGAGYMEMDHATVDENLRKFCAMAEDYIADKIYAEIVRTDLSRKLQTRRITPEKYQHVVDVVAASEERISDIAEKILKVIESSGITEKTQDMTDYLKEEPGDENESSLSWQGSLTAFLSALFAGGILSVLAAAAGVDAGLLLKGLLITGVVYVFQTLDITLERERTGHGLIAAFQGAEDIQGFEEDRIVFVKGGKLYVDKAEMSKRNKLTQMWYYYGHEVFHLKWPWMTDAKLYTAQGALMAALFSSLIARLPVTVVNAFGTGALCATALGAGMLISGYLKHRKVKRIAESFSLEVGVPDNVYDALGSDRIKELEKKRGLHMERIVSGEKRFMLGALAEKSAAKPGQNVMSALLDITVKDIEDIDGILKDFAGKTRRDIISLTHPEITSLTPRNIRKIKNIDKLRYFSGVLVRLFDDMESLELSEKSVYSLRLDRVHAARALSRMRLSVDAREYAAMSEGENRKYLSIAVDGENPAGLRLIADSIAGIGLDAKRVKEAVSGFIQVRIKTSLKPDGTRRTDAEKAALRDRVMANTGLDKYLDAKNVLIVEGDESLAETLETVRKTFPLAEKNSRVIIGDTRDLSEKETAVLMSEDAPLYVQMAPNEKGVSGVSSHLLYAMLEIALKGKDINSTIGSVASREGCPNWYIFMPRIRKIDYKRIQEEMKMYN
ncbi:MAG: hypothetical protein ABH883_05250, partial [Candidatus Omnitrophota bacterium]